MESALLVRTAASVALRGNAERALHQHPPIGDGDSGDHAV
jgi:hypothetical protein